MFVRKIARPMLASVYAFDGISMVAQPEAHAEGAEAVMNRLQTVLPRNYAAMVPQDGALIARGVGATKAAAAMMLAAGKAPRTAATTLVLLEMPTILARYAFWETQDPQVKKQRRSGLMTSLATLGGLMLASADTAGKPGVVWRTNRAAQDANKAISRALPGKSDTEKLIDAASEQASALAASTKGFLHTASDKVADVAADAKDFVEEFVDDNKDDWIAAASAGADEAKQHAMKLASAAQQYRR